MKVEQLMTHAPDTCAPDDSLAKAARIMWERDCGCVPVCASTDDGRRRLVGMITDRDVCMAAYLQGRPLGDIRVASVMARDVASCGPGETIAVALGVMRTKQLHRLPIVDVHEDLVGMLSLADVAREAARERPQRSKHVRLDDVGETIAAIDQPRAPERSVIEAA